MRLVRPCVPQRAPALCPADPRLRRRVEHGVPGTQLTHELCPGVAGTATRAADSVPVGGTWPAPSPSYPPVEGNQVRLLLVLPALLALLPPLC